MARYAIKHSKQLQRTHNLLIILLQLGHNVNLHGRVREHNHLQNAICLRLLFDTVKSGKFPYTTLTVLIISNIYRLQCTNSVLWEKMAAIRSKWIWDICYPLEIFNCVDLRLLSSLSSFLDTSHFRFPYLYCLAIISIILPLLRYSVKNRFLGTYNRMKLHLAIVDWKFFINFEVKEFMLWLKG